MYGGVFDKPVNVYHQCKHHQFGITALFFAIFCQVTTAVLSFKIPPAPGLNKSSITFELLAELIILGI